MQPFTNMRQWLESFEPGEERFYSVEAAAGNAEQKLLQTTASRIGVRFQTQQMTAVGTQTLGNVIFLMRVVRIAEEKT